VMPKFKAGDLIKTPGNSSIFEILHVGNHQYFYKSRLNDLHQYESSCNHIGFDGHYSLYTEPQTVKRWVNIYKSEGKVRMGRVVFESREQAIISSNDGLIDTIEVSYTEKES